MNILATDTAFGNLSVCVYSDKTVLSLETEHNKESQAERLFPVIENCIKKCGLEKNKNDFFDYYTACIGPGSYTGIRIGLSGLKTTAYALNKQFIGVTSLEALAWKAHKKLNVKNISVLIYANKSEAYFQNFGNISATNSDWLNLTNATVIHISEIEKHISANAILVTDNDYVLNELSSCSEKLNFDAGDIAEIAEILINNNIVSEARKSALYIKKPNAVIGG